MIKLRPATCSEAKHMKAVWVIVCSVALKRPRSGKLRWSMLPQCNDTMEAWRAAKCRGGEHKYGVIRQILLCHHPDTPGQWFQNVTAPADLRLPVEAA